MPECYIRGSTIKYLRIPDEVIDMVKEESVAKNRGRDAKAGRGNQRNRPAARGNFGGRGGGKIGNQGGGGGGGGGGGRPGFQKNKKQ